MGKEETKGMIAPSTLERGWFHLRPHPILPGSTCQKPGPSNRLSRFTVPNDKPALMLDLTFLFEVMWALATLQAPNYLWQQATHEVNEGKHFKYFTSFFITPFSKIDERGTKWALLDFTSSSLNCPGSGGKVRSSCVLLGDRGDWIIGAWVLESVTHLSHFYPEDEAFLSGWPTVTSLWPK